jgi:hypothetical protein
LYAFWKPDVTQEIAKELKERKVAPTLSTFHTVLRVFFSR